MKELKDDHCYNHHRNCACKDRQYLFTLGPLIIVGSLIISVGSLISRRVKQMGIGYRDRYSNRAENFKRPKNREDSSDLDENLTESIAAMRSIISKIFGAARLQKNCFQKFFRAIRGLNIYRWPSLRKGS